MKRIEKGTETGEDKKQNRDFAKLGRQARRYGGMAAALVCIIGLTAFLGMMGRMGASKGDMAPADLPKEEKTEEEIGTSAGLDGASDAPADDAADIPADDAADIPTDDAADIPADDAMDEPADEPADEPTDLEENADFAGEPAAPGWQEQLLAESKKADALISWHLAEVYDGVSFVLESEPADTGKTEASPDLPVSVSLICEVYYQENADEWVRVYRGDRSMSRCEPQTVWGDEYFMQGLNMTKAGTYRVVRQVNSYRQVLELTLEQSVEPE